MYPPKLYIHTYEFVPYATWSLGVGSKVLRLALLSEAHAPTRQANNVSTLPQTDAAREQ